MQHLSQLCQPMNVLIPSRVHKQDHHNRITVEPSCSTLPLALVYCLKPGILNKDSKDPNHQGGTLPFVLPYERERTLIREAEL